MPTQIFLTSPTGNWAVPADWSNVANTIEGIGGGGGGYQGSSNFPGSGGGGGAYAKISNIVLTVGASIPYTIGNGNTATFTSPDTIFRDSSTLLAQSGSNFAGTGRSAGLASQSVGTVKYSGGNGGLADGVSGHAGCGGGGAAGPNGAGLDGSVGNASVGGTGGNADAGFGGIGSTWSSGIGNDGGAGPEWGSYGSGGGGSGGFGGTGVSPAPHPAGGLYGGGSGGGNTSTGGGNVLGSYGLIVITYTPVPIAPTISVSGTTSLTPCGGAATATISWSAVPNATSYGIYRSTVSGSGYVLLTTQSGLSYTDNPPSPMTTYYYVVQAIGPGGTSGNSNEVSVAAALTITPSINSSAVTYFNSGSNYTPGMYCITFLTGSCGLGQSNLWTVNQNKDIINSSLSQAFKVTNGIDTIDGPGNYDSYATQSQCASVNLAKVVYFYHDYNKPIGMYLNDFNYANNIAGSPNPTFLICGPWAFGKLTVDHASIAPGATAVITWSITGTTDAQDINGTPIVGASGTLPVTPASTTTYLLTLVRFGIVFTTYIIVTVTRPSAPEGFVATPSCAGNVALSWNLPTNATQTLVYRGTVTGGPYTLIATVSAATVTYTDAIPVAANTYFYIIRHYDGTNYSVFSTESSAASILPIAAPASPSAILSQGQPRLLWSTVTGALSYTVYRSTSTGTEASYATGILTTSFQDTGCVNGQQYFYTVAAVNSCGAGAQTAEIPITALSNVTTMTH